MKINTDRKVVHFDLDSFFVSVERLINSKLEGKPIIIGGASDRGVVSSCSYEARSVGKIRYSNFDTHTLQKRIPYTSFDHQLIEVVKELFDRLYQRRMLIRLIGIRFSYLIQGVQQLNMFEDTPKTINLYKAMDKLRNRYGRTSIRRAVGLE